MIALYSFIYLEKKKKKGTFEGLIYLRNVEFLPKRAKEDLRSLIQLVQAYLYEGYVLNSVQLHTKHK